MVRTAGFHPANRGSIPRSATNKESRVGFFCFTYNISTIHQIKKHRGLTRCFCKTYLKLKVGKLYQISSNTSFKVLEQTK